MLIELQKFQKLKKKKKSETVKKEHGKEKSKERYISPKERQKIVDDVG